MAVCLSKSSFIGTPFPAHPSASGVAGSGSRRRNQSLLTIVSENSTLGSHGSKNIYRKQREETSSSVRADDEKPRAAWWEPLFDVSAEEQWSKLLADSSTSGTRAQPPTSARSDAIVSTAIPLQNIIESTKNERQVVPSVGTPDKIEATNEKKRRTATVIFTPEKARLLRERLRGSEVWHDGWYHSAIASRMVEESN